MDICASIQCGSGFVCDSNSPGRPCQGRVVKSFEDFLGCWGMNIQNCSELSCRPCVYVPEIIIFYFISLLAYWQKSPNVFIKFPNPGESYQNLYHFSD